MKKVLILLTTIVIAFILLSGCSNSNNKLNSSNSNNKLNSSNVANSTNNISSGTNAEKIVDTTKAIEKELNDLQLENDNESITDEDYENDVNSRLDEFSKVLSSNTDNLN